MGAVRYLSVCSGIEAASVAWHALGWKPVAFSEIEAFPSAVLRHHYPHVANWGDITRFEEWPDADVDIFVGGTPCQSFSVAGLRRGLADPRGNLMLTYLAIADKYRPEWLVWENVPGVLSSDGGRDFGTFLGGLGELGYGFAFRVLDAQFFGVAQRRRRVFVVANARGWQRAAAVLFERYSLSGNPSPSREAGQRFAKNAAGCAGDGSAYIPSVANCLETTSHDYSRADGFNMVAHTLRAEGFDASEDGTGRGTPLVPVAWTGDGVTADPISASEGRTYTHEGTTFRLHNCVQQPVAVAFHENQRGELTVNNTAGALKVGGGKPGQGYPAVAFEPRYYTRDNKTGGAPSDTAALKADASKMGDSAPHVATAMQVRRLTPTECERLQGFPDGYTNIPWRKSPEAPDGPRYKALGNSMAVPCMAWIGKRIQSVASIFEDLK
jgi:DNA (cytosine-5)-methyltransferase 1